LFARKDRHLFKSGHNFIHERVTGATWRRPPQTKVKQSPLCTLTPPQSLQMTLLYETPERFPSANIIPNNRSNFFFCHSVFGIANQILDLRGHPQQSQFKSNVCHKALKYVSYCVLLLTWAATSGNLSAPS
jgi:hypothetical protein